MRIKKYRAWFKAKMDVKGFGRAVRRFCTIIVEHKDILFGC